MNLGMAKAKKGRPVQQPQDDEWAGVRKARRLELVNGADPALAEYPLGILLARHIVTQDQHNAGLKFAWLYAKAHGRTKDCGLDYGYNGMDETRLADVEATYRQQKAILMRLSLRTFNAVVDLAVFRQMPWWFNGLSGPAWRTQDMVVNGLKALVE